KDTAERIRLIDEAANTYGNQVDYSRSTRPVVAETEGLAWANAERTNIVTPLERKRPGDVAVSNRRLRDHAQGDEAYDERLWFLIRGFDPLEDVKLWPCQSSNRRRRCSGLLYGDRPFGGAALDELGDRVA